MSKRPRAGWRRVIGSDCTRVCADCERYLVQPDGRTQVFSLRISLNCHTETSSSIYGDIDLLIHGRYCKSTQLMTTSPPGAKDALETHRDTKRPESGGRHISQTRAVPIRSYPIPRTADTWQATENASSCALAHVGGLELPHFSERAERTAQDEKP